MSLVRHPGLGTMQAFVVLFVFCALSILVYAPALSGPLLSDDIAYLVTHPYVTPLSVQNLWAIVDPFGPAKFYSANYAPVHLLATALERHIFAERVVLYHLANVVLYAVCGTLLVVALRRLSLSVAVAIAGGLFFLLHPANVEAVAWISQVKSTGALALALAAGLWLPGRPMLATLCFTASLLTKASGLFILPAVWAAGFVRRPMKSPFLGLAVIWTSLASLYAVPQFAAFEHLGAVEVAAFADLGVHVRTILSLAARYFVMTTTSLGVSAWHEPEPTVVWDVWSGAGLAIVICIAWRALRCLARREIEGACWVAVAAGWAPVSQVFPFATPLADRYVLFLLPGSIAAFSLLGVSVLQGRRLHTFARFSAALAFVAILVVFGVQTHSRAALWQNETKLLLDSAWHYPEGSSAKVLEARSAAHRGDVTRAIAALEAAAVRGADRFVAYDRDPGLAPIRNTPEFRAFLAASAGRWIELARARGYSTQPELRFLALAHQTRGERTEAVQALAAALAAGGPLDAQVREELAIARALLAEEGG